MQEIDGPEVEETENGCPHCKQDAVIRCEARDDKGDQGLNDIHSSIGVKAAYDPPDLGKRLGGRILQVDGIPLCIHPQVPDHKCESVIDQEYVNDLPGILMFIV